MRRLEQLRNVIFGLKCFRNLIFVAVFGAFCGKAVYASYSLAGVSPRIISWFIYSYFSRVGHLHKVTNIHTPTFS